MACGTVPPLGWPMAWTSCRYSGGAVMCWQERGLCLDVPAHVEQSCFTLDLLHASCLPDWKTVPVP